METEGRRILVAVDEGDESVHALRWCLANFAAPGDTVVLLYVRPPPPTYSLLDASGYLFAEEATAAIDGYSREVAESVVQKARKLCALYSREYGRANGGMKVEVKVSVGDARSVICEMVDELGADVLVMGSHGYGLFKSPVFSMVLQSSSGECQRLLRQEREPPRSHREVMKGMELVFE
ncbi:universal stress protein PHOS34 isoform X2 [Brachypodium distachyon]|uniref:universal stress protein PHOS34 isoform X2 n=1 Tax=Brachypodium distachyon TaxID=15368 RepID=UPI0001D430B6|nr:universal stress protein PHOS34 isoform X2 [Brachypodium distachyon]|eukprot:XP_010228718.1 universal stress protein PHOS34 isoform X2 [Brachypodium distachyon]